MVKKTEKKKPMTEEKIRQIVKDELSSYLEDHPKCRHGFSWTKGEDSKLNIEFTDFCQSAAKTHGRSPNAVRMRIVKLLEEDDNLGQLI